MENRWSPEEEDLLPDGMLPDNTPPDPVPYAELTVVENCVFTHHEQQPFGTESRYGRHLYTHQRPVTRAFEVGEEWVSLPPELLTNPVGMLAISNEKEELLVIPTREERDRMASRILQVRSGESGSWWLVRPGGSMRGEPLDAHKISLRCASGSTLAVVTAFWS